MPLTEKDFRNTDLYNLYQNIGTGSGTYTGTKLTPVLLRTTGDFTLATQGNVKMVSIVNNGSVGVNATVLGQPLKDGEIITYNTMGSSDYLSGGDFTGSAGAGSGNELVFVILK